jgi:hypothetical protein
MLIEIINLSGDRCSETLVVIMFRYLIWCLYSLINTFLQLLIIINNSLIGECDEIQANIPVPVFLTVWCFLHIMTRFISAVLELIILPIFWGTRSVVSKYIRGLNVYIHISGIFVIIAVGQAIL